MKDRDFQTLSLFAVLAVLTVLFVMGSRAVLFAPLATEAAKPEVKKTVNLELGQIFSGQEAKKGP